MARPATLLKDDLRTPQEEIQIVRKHKHTTTIQRRVQRGHHWVWNPEVEKIATERILDDGGQRWRNYENNPTIATWCDAHGEPQATLTIHRSYSRITKAQVYHGRDAEGASQWSGIEEINSANIVLDGGAGWGWRPPAWELATKATPTEDHGHQDNKDEDTATATTLTPAPEPAGQKVTYLRVSSTDQSLERQREALRHVGARKEFSDEISARSRAGRPGLDACLEYLRDGDELHVSSIDRLARSLIDLKQLVAELTEMGVTVVFHKENLRFSAGQDDPTANLMLGILGSFAEFERTIIRERQAEGIKLAKKAGKYEGRPKALTDTQVAEVRRRAEAGEAKTAIAKDLGVSRATIYRVLKEKE